MSDDENEFNFGSDIDDAELLEIAMQAEQQQSTSSNSNPSSSEFSLPAWQQHQAIQTRPNAGGGGKQMTLFGEVATGPADGFGSSSQRTSQQGAYSQQSSRPSQPEQPTHHKIDREAAKMWAYPINMEKRAYQFNIVQAALRRNVLAALPTGLGKTFIAATVMLNWYRWAPEGQILFLAPTKPLVHQQIDACYNIVGIPRSDTAFLTGEVRKSIRQEYWEDRRVFFSTPQTVMNDISSGICDARKIVCLVVDEAHRATGSFAYVEVCKKIRRENESFRILALTATPGTNVESVQSVIDNLGIAEIQIRTDESIDIVPYIKKKQVDIEVFPLGDELTEIRDLYCKCLDPILKKLTSVKAYWNNNSESLSCFGLQQARQSWMNSAEAQRIKTSSQGHFYSLLKAFATLASLAHPLALLQTHGLRLFYDKLTHPHDEDVEGVSASKKAIQTIQKDPNYGELIARTAAIIDNPNFSGHPKMDHMLEAILDHFVQAEDEDEKRETRIIVFTNFRDSAEDICKFLRRHEPMIRPHVFVGQANAKGSAGMAQKEQLEVIRKFNDGTYNTIIATSIGEEGLDIGEVDLIVCYDTNSSGIRLLQRIGRTGRKRNGRVIVLLTEGKEELKYRQAQDQHKVMQRKIAGKKDFTYRNDLSSRIIPPDIDPKPCEQIIEIPIENTQPESNKRTRKKRKAPTKKFFMPKGVKMGFEKASRLGEDDGSNSGSDASDCEPRRIVEEGPIAKLGNPEDVLLTEAEFKMLMRRYGTDTSSPNDCVVVEMPRLDAFPEDQRKLTPIHHISHGRASKAVVDVIRRMNEIDDDTIRELEADFDPELLRSPKKTKAFKPLRPVKSGGVFQKSSVLAKKSGNTVPPMKSLTAKKRTAPARTVPSSEEDDDDDDDEPPPPRAKIPPMKSSTAKRRAAPARVVLSSSDDGGDEEPPSRKTKRRKTVNGRSGSESSSGKLGLVSSDSDLPDARTLIQGFRSASSLKRR